MTARTIREMTDSEVLAAANVGVPRLTSFAAEILRLREALREAEKKAQEVIAKRNASDWREAREALVEISARLRETIGLAGAVR